MDNVRMDLKQDGLEWVGVIWLKTDNWRTLVNAIKNSRFQQNAGTFLSGGEPVGFCSRAVPIILVN